jgi:hypothetical protein
VGQDGGAGEGEESGGIGGGVGDHVGYCSTRGVVCQGGFVAHGVRGGAGRVVCCVWGMYVEGRARETYCLSLIFEVVCRLCCIMCWMIL